MTCEESNNLLSARLDGEILPEDAAALDAHLRECTACATMAEVLANQNRQLEHAFTKRRQAARRIADDVIGNLPLGVSRGAPNRWLPQLLAAAAGFIIAALIFQPWTRTSKDVTVIQPPTTSTQTRLATPPAPIVPAAQLSLATGKVEILSAQNADWCAMDTGGVVPLDARVRTGPNIRCEFVCPDGSQVRLNENTELHFTGPRTLELADGQVWSGVAMGKDAFTVSLAAPSDAIFTCTANGSPIPPPIQSVGSEPAARFDVANHSGRASLAVLAGETRVTGGNSQTVLHSGQMVEIINGKTEPPRAISDYDRAARWIDELLVLKGRNNPELAEHITALLARLGNDKMQYLLEAEIRGLGDHCVLPLTRYIQSDLSRDNPAKRVSAARIAADCAQPWCVPYLIELLADRDGQVRAAAGRGLRRVTNADIGDDADWLLAQPAQRDELVRSWQSWWEGNKARVPGSSEQESRPANGVPAVKKA